MLQLSKLKEKPQVKFIQKDGYGLYLRDGFCIILDKEPKKSVIEDSRQVIPKVKMEENRNFVLRFNDVREVVLKEQAKDDS